MSDPYSEAYLNSIRRNADALLRIALNQLAEAEAQLAVKTAECEALKTEKAEKASKK